MALPAILAAAARGAGAAATKGIHAPVKTSPRLFERLWGLESAWNMAEKVAGSTLPQFQHACTVTCQGGPDADIRRVWYMTCAVAFGRMIKSPALRGGDATMQATWDITGKATQIELVYAANRFGQAGERIPALIGGMDPVGRRFAAGLSPKTQGVALIQIGPDQITIGSGWPDFLLFTGQGETSVSRLDLVEGTTLRDQYERLQARYRVVETRNLDLAPRNLLREWPIGGIAADGRFRVTRVPWRAVVLKGANYAGPINFSNCSESVAPYLPDDGRIVTTGEKTHAAVQPVRPILEGATRTSLIALFSQELHEPCYLPDSPHLTDTPLYSAGTYAADAGEWTGDRFAYDKLSQQIRLTIAQYAVVFENPGTPADRFPDGVGLPETFPDYRVIE